MIDVVYIPADHDRFAEVVAELRHVSRCRRRPVAALVVKNGRVLGSGTNDPQTPRERCLRQGMASGVGYELCRFCRQEGHAEAVALFSCYERGNNPEDGTVVLAGHDHVCERCLVLMRRAGIVAVHIVQV